MGDAIGWLVVAASLIASTAAAQGGPLKHTSAVSSKARAELRESSGAAMSIRQPGVFFTINDSGNEPLLFAMDTTGADRGVWRVVRSANVDWESIAVGPCGSAKDAGRPNAGPPACVYIGDTGDNQEKHPSRRIYRVDEPRALASGEVGNVRAEHVTYVYEDGPHDVEAMIVAANGDMLLITKRPRSAPGGSRLRPALVFRLPANAWTMNGVLIARLVDSLPQIVPGSVPLGLVTDASLAADGKRLAVRTYTKLYLFATDATTGMVNHAIQPTVCDLTPLGERQGEGVTWVTATRLLFTSEGVAAPIHLGEC